MITPGGNKRLVLGKKNRAARKAISSNVSIGSGSSYGSASSARSDISSLSDASASLASSQRSSFNRPRVSATQTPLPPPCHLNCKCNECTKPNSDFLDGLLNLSPDASQNIAESSQDPLDLLLGDFEDFSF
eukprot:CAMPEP_0119023412 /NCGR_PEP_ID=MMETSP1176-20130426/29917_1 /TAXON_ID=265551 /ORGANISM="Synedropsis recta cf, Strain CCMP1620" /LENGTH=130 /DNA_ID=CAMNT_0006978493 /DNA_START=144 /DNA_END=536 /DNA_ORIENTATION=-